MNEFLFEILSKIYPLPKEEWKKVDSIFYERHISEGTFFLRTGDKALDFAIIKKGLTRFFYTTSSGKEFTKALDHEGDLIGGYTSLLTGRPSAFCIQALEDTDLFCTKWADFSKLFEKNYHWQAVGRRFAEIEFIKKEAREADFLLKNAEERYLSFIREFPEGEKRIAHIHIASYLGIDPATLCRIRKKCLNDKVFRPR